ncbi:mannose-1-phosphate guanylyltransferase/mannose-6-phosphate isomerase [Parasphingopyxis algicola]|uniref:mannose-1-phosphate guanylyltransferase/mannose-6-phosphate isomerase n=1 Tax=Parasphingopyxis algicola TaxID=2026624 RepID=UPI0015A344C9|nr:mannose-1-phosphate guanylyltransferase/mannose-6-phosphate isomerase [Parasphingopyxis algicola]QLC25875.1 mannose-1-phosphate guanylyltransferase/mannose-6-phosphate isomerase [Parasphingopyxis algicola]
MTKPPIIPVILTGGSGTRLWPLSRAARAKQFLPLTGETTMLERTMDRVSGEGFGPPLLVGGAAQAEILQALAGEAEMILEPEARNTAPAIALAALALPPETPMLVMPSDQVIADIAAFEAAIGGAAALAADGWLVTFGIAPTGPETGYGYIRQGEALDDRGFQVDRFIEKPDRETAQGFLDAGGYHWNGGIFLFTAGRYLEALGKHAPEILTAARAAFDAGRRDGMVHRPEAAGFAEAPSISIDYAVMEKAEKVAVVPVAMGWSDIGSWDALHDLMDKDIAGNSLRGDVLAIDTANSLIRSEGPKVATVGVEDLIVVATDDAVLILPRGESQRVKEAVEALKAGKDGGKLL